MATIKIFLGGFINFANAQNLNCRSLAEHLNSEKFQVYTLTLAGGQLEFFEKRKNIHLFHCFLPARISVYLGFMWGIWHCDVAYLPKGELWKWNRFLLKLFNKRSFSTVEGIIDENVMNTAISIHGSQSNFIKSQTYLDKLYSITNFLKNYNFEKYRIKTEIDILYLGVDLKKFNIQSSVKNNIKVLMIGNDLVRKGLYDYFEIATHFPEITFYLAGSGNGKVDVASEIIKRNIQNVIYKGLVTTNGLLALLKEVNLHILPSRSEGFPKVILETAAAGVPTILYSDYGASEWISHNKNGWIFSSIEEIIILLKELKSSPKKIEEVSLGAIELAQSFDWKTRVIDWEEVIMNLANGNN